MATGDVSYVPGALTAVTGDQCWALVDTSPDSPVVTRTWQQLGQGAAADALLAGLVADGLGGTPALPCWWRGLADSTGCSAEARSVPPSSGEPGLAVPRPAGGRHAERIDGTGLLTWREQVVDGAMRIFLGEPPADTALRLPAHPACCWPGCVIIDLTDVASRETVHTTRKYPKRAGKNRRRPSSFTRKR